MSAISGHAPGFSAFLRGVVATRNLGLVVVLSVLWKYNLPQKYNRKMPSILLGVLMSAPDGRFRSWRRPLTPDSDGSTNRAGDELE